MEPQEDQKNSNEKKPWIAAILSILLPGLGHVYHGEIKKGILLLSILFVLTMILALSSIGPYFIGFVSLLTLIAGVFLFSTIDAFISTKRRPHTKKQIFDRWYVYVLILIGVGFALQLVYIPVRNKIGNIHFAKIPTSSMSPALNPGDRISWSKSKFIQRNDIAVFEYIGEPNSMYISRCVAAPGDELEIRQGLVYIDNKLVDNPKYIKFRHLIEGDGNLTVSDLGITENLVQDMGGQYFVVDLTEEEAKLYNRVPHLNKIKPLIEENGIGSEQVFPFSADSEWNFDNYGKITIPKKGSSIKINIMNAAFYGMVISSCEGIPVTINEEGLLEIDDKILNAYTFKQNYYFVMGDNRHNSVDSRLKGLIPESLILGTANYIWWSNEKSKIGNTLR